MEKGKLNKNQWIGVGLVGVLTVVCIVVIVGVLIFYKKPLGTALDTPSRSASASDRAKHGSGYSCRYSYAQHSGKSMW